MCLLHYGGDLITLWPLCLGYSVLWGQLDLDIEYDITAAFF